jgi:hypothetical protein
MPNQRMFRIILAIACFVFAGVKGYQIMQGEYTWMDVFFMIAFLGFGVMYVVLLNRKRKDQQ